MPPTKIPGYAATDRMPPVADGTLPPVNAPRPGPSGGLIERSLYHEYTHTTILCQTSKMSLDAVFALLLSSAQYIAPTDDRRPVVDQMIVQVRIGARGVVISRHNPIRVTINRAGHAVTNTTMPGHMLHPGSVTRSLVEKDGVISIHTFGVGTGRVQGSLNYILCSPLLDHLLPRRDTPSGFANNVAAAIVWGEVDAGLKQRIDGGGAGAGGETGARRGAAFRGAGGSSGGAGASGRW